MSEDPLYILSAGKEYRLLSISKPSQSSGSRYATAEDIPGVRSSLPDYTSTRFDDDRLGKASLPPRPQSARSR
jgi:hypothetical protein